MKCRFATKPARNTRPARSGCALLACTILASAACSAPQKSVKPGINDAYKGDVDIDRWLGTFEIESREIYRERERILDALSLKPGERVADIGAGTGFLSAMMAQRVGRKGKVYAVDIVPEFIELIETRAIEDGLTNIVGVVCKDDSVSLPPRSVSVALICDTYHHFEYPKSTMRSLRRAMRSGGRLYIVDFERIPGKSRAWILNHVRTGKVGVIAELERFGFEYVGPVEAGEALEENYFIEFKRR